MHRPVHKTIAEMRGQQTHPDRAATIVRRTEPGGEAEAEDAAGAGGGSALLLLQERLHLLLLVAAAELRRQQRSDLVTCPQRYRWHLEKNATEMAAIS
eukprot:COSAG04_NODE_18210_length_448_cov_1.146132_1_plen_98_part_00